MVKISLFVFLVLGLPVLKAQATPDCGKYPIASTQQGPACHRVGILPWLVGIPGAWETEMRFGTSGDPVRFSYGSSLSLLYYDVNLLLEDSLFGSATFESSSEIPVGSHGSHWTRIMGACHALAGQCPPQSAVGSMIVTVDAPSVTALEAASASAVYRYTSNGVVVSETTAPVIFLDQAAARWSAIITETPRDRQSQPGATITSVAVANLSPIPQAVLVRIYNEFGILTASAKTPVLDQALGFSGSTEVLVGVVYADTLSNILGLNLAVNSCSNCTSTPVFRGTVILEGEKGGLIAPAVFRLNGPALTTVPVKAE